MTTKYIFSCYVKRPQARLLRRPWWNLWGRDKIVYSNQWERLTISGLPKEQADALIQASAIRGFVGTWQTLFLRALGPGAWGIQLEESPSGTSYAPSEYVDTRRSRE